MRRIKLILAVVAVMVVTLFVVAGPAAADHDVDVDIVDVFIRGDEICVVLEVEGFEDDEEEIVIECEDIDDIEDIF